MKILPVRSQRVILGPCELRVLNRNQNNKQIRCRKWNFSIVSLFLCEGFSIDDSIKDVASLDESPVRERSSSDTKPKPKSELISISELEAEVETEINQREQNYQIDLHELDSLHQVSHPFEYT